MGQAEVLLAVETGRGQIREEWLLNASLGLEPGIPAGWRCLLGTQIPRPSLGALDSVSQGRAPGTVFDNCPLYSQVGSAILYDQLCLAAEGEVGGRDQGDPSVWVVHLMVSFAAGGAQKQEKGPSQDVLAVSCLGHPGPRRQWAAWS